MKLGGMYSDHRQGNSCGKHEFMYGGSNCSYRLEEYILLIIEQVKVELHILV